MDVNSGKRLPRNRREPEAFSGRQITERTLAICEIIARYRVIASSAIIRLVGGNEDVTHRHLQLLYHRNVVGRVGRPGPSRNTEFAYYLENSPQMRSVFPKQRLKELGIEIERRKPGVGAQSSAGRLLFIEHELMIADFHAAIELAARTSDGRVELEEWKQGTSTWGRVKAKNGNALVILPHRPDAYFVLRFPAAAEGQQRARFFCEADRGTTSTTRFKLKLQAYLSFLLSGQYAEKYNAQRVRAVLIETITQNRMQQLVAVASALAETEPLAAALFWFTASDEIRNKGGFAAVWSTPMDGRKRSVLD